MEDIYRKNYLGESVMRYRNIPNTDINVSSICMGGGPFCVENAMNKSYQLLDTYCQLGGNFIDTANIYGKWLSKGTNLSEIIIGQWMREKKNRDKMIIATKGGHPALATMNKSRLSKDEVAEDLNESLKALQTDYTDLYWLHRDDETIPVETIINYLNEFVKQGKIRFFGCSNWKVYRIKEAMEYAQKNNLMGFIGNEMMWSLAEPNMNNIADKTLVAMDESCYKFHKETGLCAIPYSSQANGFFNKLEKEESTALTDSIKNVYYNEKNVKRFERIKKLSQETSKSITEIVLGYLIAQPFTTIPIVGSRTVEQLVESMKAGDVVLDESIVRYLAKVD